MQQLDIGETTTIITNWWDQHKVPANPSAITLTITAPDGTVVVVTKALMTQGATVDVWEHSFVADQEGVWLVATTGMVAGFAIIKPTTVILVGAGTTTGPCEPWTSWDEIGYCGTPPALDPVARELVIDQASEILYNLTHRVYPGICTTTKSLCYACGRCTPSICSCEPYPSIDMGRRWPIWGAWDVIIDHVPLPPSAYRVRKRRWLVRLDGQSWPSGWNSTDPSAFSVTWAYGRKPPAGGRTAASRFALEIAKLCAGAPCQVSQYVTTVNREGLNMVILDSSRIIAEGRTGLPMVDLWLISDREGRKAAPRAFSPSSSAPGVRRI